MTTYVAFLRAINLGATRKFPKDAIIAAAEGAGFTGVRTHINTGNVLVETSRRSRAAVEKALEAAFLADRGFEVPVIAFTVEELRAVVADADDLAAAFPDMAASYVSLLKEEPGEDVRREVEAASTATERLAIRGRAAHLLLAERGTYHLASLSNASLEKRLGVATNRNMTVLRAIADKWC